MVLNCKTERDAIGKHISMHFTIKHTQSHTHTHTHTIPGLGNHFGFPEVLVLTTAYVLVPATTVCKVFLT